MKRMAVVVTASLFFSGFTFNSFAVSPVAGAKCTKVGATQIYKGKKFICVKSGTKLFWNYFHKSSLSPSQKNNKNSNSDNVKNSETLPSKILFGNLIYSSKIFVLGDSLVFDLPVESNLEIKSNSGILRGSEAKNNSVVNGRLVIGNSTKGTWRYEFDNTKDLKPGIYNLSVLVSDSTGQTVENKLLDITINSKIEEPQYLKSFKETWLKSRNLIRSKWPNSHNGITIDFHYTSSFPNFWLDSWKEQVEKSINFFSQFIEKPETFHIYFLTEKDLNFMDHFGIWDANNTPTHFKYWEQNQDLNNCEGAVGSYFKRKDDSAPTFNGGIAIASNAYLDRLRGECKSIITHESFHALQDYFLTFKMGNTGFQSDEIYDNVQMPIFREGSAETISYAIGQESPDVAHKAFYERFHDFVVNSSEVSGILTNQDVVQYMKLIERRSASKDAHDSSYLFGMVFWDYLIANYDFEKFVYLLKNQNRDTPMKEVFQKSYGFDIETAYKESAEHILNALLILRN